MLRMCRFAAYVGASHALSSLLFGGEHSLAEQSWAPRELLSGSVNVDGWGAVWWSGSRAVRIARDSPVWHDPDIRTLLETVSSGVAVTALRNATPGLPVDASSIPPLVLDDRAFVLNGWVPAFRERHMRVLRAGLPDSLYARLSGSSDVETLFLIALAAVEAGASRAEALAAVVRVVLERVAADRDPRECQLTLLLADAGGLTVCRTSNVERVNSLYRCREGALCPGGTLVASERLDDDPGWEPVPAHTLVDFDAEGIRETALPDPAIWTIREEAESRV